MTNEITKYAVEHNDLITSIAKMDRVPLKMFELAVAQINTDEPPKNNQVLLSKQELFDFFEATDSNKYGRFKQSLEQMQKQAYFKIKQEKRNGGYKYELIVPIPYINWNDYSDEVTIEFNRHIMPYLIDLKTNFTKYAINELMELESKYSIILFKLLTMNYNQFEHYRFKANRTQQQLEEYKNPVISIEELRAMTDTTDKHAHFPHFEKAVIKKAVTEINATTNLNVDYKKIKKGRSIQSIQFFIDKKQVAPVPSVEYKKNDEAFEEQQASNDLLYIDSVSSEYTKLLLKAEILDVSDVSDVALICNLGKALYPIYDKLDGNYGETVIYKHINYVKDHMLDYSKQNLCKYLVTAATTFSARMAKQAPKNTNKVNAGEMTFEEVPLKNWI